MWGAAVAFIASEVWWDVLNRNVAGPYMDEEFHVRQTEAYIAGNWTQWDPKITTPPGLYVAGVGWFQAVQHIMRIADSDTPPTVLVLRALSPFVFAPIVLLCSDLLRSTQFSETLHRTDHPNAHTTRGPTAAQAAALSIGTLPTLFFFSAFYYTDVASLFCLAALAACLHSKSSKGFFASALCIASSFWALSLRQTNLVWVGFLYAGAIFRRCEVSAVLEILTKAHLCVYSAVVHYPGLLLVLGGSAVFLAANGGIVLGDKSNHAAAFHPTQLVYGAALFGCFYPMACLRGVVARRSRGVLRTALGALLWSAFAAYCLRFHVIAHPFTLADNRHYPFYLWRRLGMGDDASNLRYAVLLPASLFGFAGIAEILRAMRPALAFLFVLGTGATLVPSPLFEPRYFIIPTALLVLANGALLPPHLESYCCSASFLHIALHAAVNAATIYLFVERVFTAPDGSVGRLMW